jgi:hypothetical protein
MDELRLLAFIDLAPQMRDVHIDYVVERCYAMDLMPYILGEHVSCDRLPLMTREIAEEVEFFRCERDLACATPCSALRLIDHEIAHAPVQRVGLGPPYQSPHTRRELGKGKRLDEVVVGATVQPKHAIFDGVARRQ